MNRHILFLHGGGGIDDYAADAKMVASLQTVLGDAYVVHYPFLRNETAPDYGRKKQIGKQISLIRSELILVAHSLGASILLKYLSESRSRKKIAGVFLIATPFWSGSEDWKQGFILQHDFADKISGNIPLFLYQSKDDREVPFEHLGMYAQHLPQAKIRKLKNGGHQLGNNLTCVAKDIKALSVMNKE